MRNAKANNQLSDNISGAQARIATYLDLIVQWNAVAGLVAKGDLDCLESIHVQDSLSLRPLVDTSRSHLDIGSGGGFPAIPLAIYAPETEFTLVERNQKRCNFLKHVALALSLENVQVLETDIRAMDEVSSFETLTARAVSSPHQIWQWCRQFLTPQGTYLAQTGNAIDEPFTRGEVVNQHPTARGWLTQVRRQDA